MRSVNIAELKNNLSRYLRQVRQGEEILIRDRTIPVAKIVPLPMAGECSEEILQLAAQGLVRLPKKKLDLDEFSRLPGPRIPWKRMVAAVVAERDEDY